MVPECVVFGTRAGEPPPCGVCQAGHVVEDAKRAGQLPAVASLPEEKRPDAVGALAVVIAARHPEAIAVTSDQRDLLAYRDALTDGGAGVRILPVAEVQGFLAGKRVLLQQAGPRTALSRWTVFDTPVPEQPAVGVGHRAPVTSPWPPENTHPLERGADVVVTFSVMTGAI